jgi:arylsulfatase
MGVAELPTFDDDIWELYDTNTDWSQARDLAAEHPDKLAELQRLWLIEAARNQVLPLDDRFIERANPDIAGRPQLIRGNQQRLLPGMRLTEHSVINLKNKSHTVTAEVTVPSSGAQGVVVAQGGRFGGWSLYAHAGKLKYCYNAAGIQVTRIEGQTPIPAGTHELRIEFAYDGGGLGKGGTVTLFLDGQIDGEGRVQRTMPFVYSIDETCDIGHDAGTPVSPEYAAADNRFSGAVNWVDLAADSAPPSSSPSRTIGDRDDGAVAALKARRLP